MIIAIIVIAVIVAMMPPAPYIPPDLARCSMAHGFVIGEAPDFSGSVEIWKCPSSTLVTLNQLQVEGAERRAVTRSHFSPVAGPGEQLRGCRGTDENFDGSVAFVTSSGSGKPRLQRAWKADLEKWQFVGIATDGLTCNRGLTVD